MTKSTYALLFGPLSLLATFSQAHSEKIESDPSLIPENENTLVGEHSAKLESITYRPGKGLQVKSEDGLFNLVTRLRLQTLATVSNAQNDPAEVGIQLRRARLQFLGTSYGKHNKFKAEFAFSPRDLRFKAVDSDVFPRESPLLTWYLEFDHLRDLTVRVGQYKIPFSRQRVISSGNQQMVDRSIANGEFNLDRDIGIDIRSKDFLGLDKLRYYIGIYNGEGRSVFANGDSNLMYLARVEYLPLGLFDDYSEGDFQRLATPGISIGASYAFAPNASGTRVNRNGSPDDGGTTDFQSAVADLTLKYKGLAVSSEFFWRDGVRNSGQALDSDGIIIPTEAARNGLGWFTQAGYLIPGMPLEVTGRFGQVLAADESTLSDRNELGLAVSYYFAKHPFKLQADSFQTWDDEFSDGTTRIRVQSQLSF